MQSAKAYAKRVISGDIIAGKWVQLACQRHLDDLGRVSDPKWPYEFDEDLANRVVLFFENMLKHSKGQWSGQYFQLELWQKFIISNIFGWVDKKSKLRRYRTVYIEVARKNGKTTLVAGLGVYLLSFDDEAGSEVYSAATKRDQAKISFSEAQRMVKKSGTLKNYIKVFKHNMHIPDTASKFEPLGADADSMDGLNVHAGLIDELHAHKKRDVWDVLETATGARRQPLLVAITTAGYDQAGICYEQHQYLKSILAKTVVDDTYFGVIYAIDKDDRDDWQNPNIWVKANPNLGVSVYLDDLERKAKKAAEIPAAQNNFLRKHLDIWTQQFNRWIDLTVWDENSTKPVIESKYEGKMGVGGIDLSSVKDLTAWVMAFSDPKDPEQIDLIMRCWCPESRLFDTENRYRDQYQAWRDEGFLITTEGDAIDYDYVRAKILEDVNRFRITEIAIDRLFQGYEFAQKLNEQMGGSEKKPKLFACGMGYLSMAGPCKEFESRLLKRKLNHGKNPVLRFMADNVSVSMDPAGNLKPNKATSQGKIDGIIGILLCLDRILRKQPIRTVRMPSVV